MRLSKNIKIMRLKSSFIFAFFLLGTLTYGQVHLGATTAYNATFVLDKGLNEDPRYNSTYTYQLAPIGFSFGVDIGKNLVLVWSQYFPIKARFIK